MSANTTTRTTMVKTMSKIKPCQTMRGHTEAVWGVAHLLDGQHIITCSTDGSLRVWNLKSGAQIGNDWRDSMDETGLTGIAISPNGKIVASGGNDGTVWLWDIEKKQVTAKWTDHTNGVWSVCWNAYSERVVTGSSDGTVRVWDVKNGKTVLGPINTGHKWVWAVAYSPDATKIATGGYNKTGIKIWDATTGELLSTLNHDHSPIGCLAWTSDQKNLISASSDSIRIFNTTTWHQIATLMGHNIYIRAISLFQNDRLLASASEDGTARLWNLDTNLQVGPPLHHGETVRATSFSGDGNFLVTACGDGNTYVWDIHAILEEAGLEDLIYPQTNNLKAGKSIMDSGASRRPAPLEDTRRLTRSFFDNTQDGENYIAAHIHPHPSTHRGRYVLAPFLASGALLDRFTLRFRRSQHNTDGSIQLQQRPRQSVVSDRAPAVIEVAAGRDKKPLYVARRPETVNDMAKRIKNPTRWTRCVLFLCCISAQEQETDGNQ